MPSPAARLKRHAGAEGLFQGMSFWMGPGYKGTGVSPHQLTELLTCTGGRVLEHLPPHLTGLHCLLCSLSAPLCSSHLAACLFNSLTYSLTRSLTHPLTHSPTPSPTHSLPHPPTLSLPAFLPFFLPASGSGLNHTGNLNLLYHLVTTCVWPWYP